MIFTGINSDGATPAAVTSTGLIPPAGKAPQSIATPTVAPVAGSPATTADAFRVAAMSGTIPAAAPRVESVFPSTHSSPQVPYPFPRAGAEAASSEAAGAGGTGVEAASAGIASAGVISAGGANVRTESAGGDTAAAGGLAVSAGDAVPAQESVFGSPVTATRRSTRENSQSQQQPPSQAMAGGLAAGFDAGPPADPFQATSGAGGSGGSPGKQKPRKRRPLVTLLIVVLCMAAVGAGGYLAWNAISGAFNPPMIAVEAPDYEGPGGDPVTIVIPQGSTGADIGSILFGAGVVASQQAFTEAFTANPQAVGIQPGTYELREQMRAVDAVTLLVASTPLQGSVTFPEGFTVDQIVDRLEAQTHISRADLEAALAQPDLFGLPEEAGGYAEGWLFPATYTIQPSDTAVSVLSQMVARTVQELESFSVPRDQWARILNVASLIEREVRNPDYKPQVARAVENRLDQGMHLQIDAAVAYGLGISGMDLTLAHLADAENPFNTYQHLGLPPTPIANPGAASIEAAINPADGPWIFWVTVNLDTGETWFSTTYAEHNVGVAELRRWEAENLG